MKGAKGGRIESKERKGSGRRKEKGETERKKGNWRAFGQSEEPRVTAESEDNSGRWRKTPREAHQIWSQTGVFINPGTSATKSATFISGVSAASWGGAARSFYSSKVITTPPFVVLALVFICIAMNTELFVAVKVG